MEYQYKVGDKVRVSAEADDVHFGGEIVGVVTDLDVAAVGFQQYTDEQRILVNGPDLEVGGNLDQWVRPADLELVEAAA